MLLLLHLCIFLITVYAMAENGTPPHIRPYIPGGSPGELPAPRETSPYRLLSSYSKVMQNNQTAIHVGHLADLMHAYPPASPAEATTLLQQMAVTARFLFDEWHSQLSRRESRNMETFLDIDLPFPNPPSANPKAFYEEMLTFTVHLGEEIIQASIPTSQSGLSQSQLYCIGEHLAFEEQRERRNKNI